MVAVPVQSKRTLSRLDKARIAREANSVSRFKDSFVKASELLIRADKEHRNHFHAEKYFHPALSKLENIELAINRANSNARVGKHYFVVHSMMDYYSKGDLAGKNILHIAASTGVYVKFLQEFCGANAVALDVNKVALRDAASRGVKKVMHANALPVRVRGKPVGLPEGKGVWIPREKRTPLRLPSDHFHFIVSDHFLFSNFYPQSTAHSMFVGTQGAGKTVGIERAYGSFEESEFALKEYNRVLKKGGRLIVSSAKPKELPALGKYRKWFRIHGFIVEGVFDRHLKTIFQDPTDENLADHPNKLGPRYFVLKKIANL